MDALENMKKAIAYIEAHLTHEINLDEIAQIALCSPYHFRRMFMFLVGVPLSEYIRRRRLTLAAFDLQNSTDKIIDIAMKYGYSSPDAFARAFQTVHHITPSRAREKGTSLKAYPRISFSLSLKGALEMNYRIEEKDAFRIAGVKKCLSYTDDLGQKVGEMWSNLQQDIMAKILEQNDTGPFGLVGAYAGMYDDKTTDYYIGVITTKQNPKDLAVLEIPSQSWAVFEIKGPMPNAMRETWGRIFSEWFPTSGYEHAQSPEIEWYSQGDMGDDDYESEIWIPIHKK